jgi:hypothetical protein
VCVCIYIVIKKIFAVTVLRRCMRIKSNLNKMKLHKKIRVDVPWLIPFCSYSSHLLILKLIYAFYFLRWIIFNKKIPQLSEPTLKDIKWMYKSINRKLIAIKISCKTTKIAKNKQHVHTFFRLKMIKMIMHYGYWGHWSILSQLIKAFYFWEFNGFHMSAVILLVYRQLFD